MYLRSLSSVFLTAVLPLAAAGPRVLRVCADPNNLPYSNQREEGFENQLARLVARSLRAELQYSWWPQRRAFLRNSLNAGECDAVMGVPTTLETVETTKPYYSSTYVFLSRQDRDLHVSSLGDPRLANWRIGIHLAGDDYTPPAHALIACGLAANLVPYRLIGAGGEENPPARLVDGVIHGDVDLAVIWGPFAGYFAKYAKVPLAIAPVSPQMYRMVPFTYAMAIGVRKGDAALRAELDHVLEQECAAVANLLRGYGVPLAEKEKGECNGSH